MAYRRRWSQADLLGLGRVQHIRAPSGSGVGGPALSMRSDITARNGYMGAPEAAFKPGRNHAAWALSFDTSLRLRLMG